MAENGNREQSTVAAAIAANSVLTGSYDGFGVPSAQSSPDCQPPRPTSSMNWKLKNAPTAGWQYASSTASFSWLAWSGTTIAERTFGATGWTSWRFGSLPVYPERLSLGTTVSKPSSRYQIVTGQLERGQRPRAGAAAGRRDRCRSRGPAAPVPPNAVVRTCIRRT